MRPLRILLIMIEPPVPFGHALGRWFHVLLKGLVERGHRVTAIAACSNRQEMEAARDLFPTAEYDLQLIPFAAPRGLRSKWDTLRRPFSYPFSPDFLAAFGRAARNGFDVLHLEQLSSGWVGLEHAQRALLNVHFLYSIDLADAHRGLDGAVRRWLMGRMERRLLRHYPRLLTLSDRLCDGIRRIAPNATVNVVPLGFDPSHYPFIPDDRRTTEPVIGLVGGMGWYPSFSAATRLLTRLWPRIKGRVPDAKVQIVGRSARSALTEFLGSPDVTIEENVPDVRPYFARTGVFLYAPARGSGMKVKIQEAMALGVPIVTTSEGVEGIPADDGVHAGICDDDDGLVDRTVRLLLNPAAQNRQRTAARDLLGRICGPKTTLDALEAVYAPILRSGAA